MDSHSNTLAYYLGHFVQEICPNSSEHRITLNSNLTSQVTVLMTERQGKEIRVSGMSNPLLLGTLQHITPSVSYTKV